MDLHDSLTTGRRVVMHIGIEKAETSVGQCIHLCCLEEVSHRQLESPRDDSHVFPERMPVRWNALPIRHLQADGEVAT